MGLALRLTLDGHAEAEPTPPAEARENGLDVATPGEDHAAGAAAAALGHRPGFAMPEPPLYRPLGLLAFGTSLGGGTPLGIWMLFRLYGGGGGVPVEWTLLHAQLQIFGFFGVLILGVAQHLLPRFAGRSPAPHPGIPRLTILATAALALRVGGTLAQRPAWILAAALIQAAAFGAFAVWVWQTLALPRLAVTRTQLTLSTAWLVLALLFEAALWWQTLGTAFPQPDPGGMRAVYLMALFGGVVGWMLGVAERAGPMFVAAWSVPDRLARTAPWMLSGAVLVGVGGEAGGWEASTATALSKLGETLALTTVVAVALAAGAARSDRRALPFLGRSGPETRLFRLGLASAGTAAVGSAWATALAWSGTPLSLLADVLRHLVTVGFLTSVVVAMAFRLVPILEGVPPPWPRLRTVAGGALLAGVTLRTAELLADYVTASILPWVPLSGLLIWVALACVLATLLGAIRSRPR